MLTPARFYHNDYRRSSQTLRIYSAADISEYRSLGQTAPDSGAARLRSSSTSLFSDQNRPAKTASLATRNNLFVLHFESWGKEFWMRARLCIY
jgi:hypothetical protein